MGKCGRRSIVQEGRYAEALLAARTRQAEAKVGGLRQARTLPRDGSQFHRAPDKAQTCRRSNASDVLRISGELQRSAGAATNEPRLEIRMVEVEMWIRPPTLAVSIGTDASKDRRGRRSQPSSNDLSV